MSKQTVFIPRSVAPHGCPRRWGRFAAPPPPVSTDQRPPRAEAGDLASPRRGGKLTFIVEEAAVDQDEPALVPLLNPGAGLWGAGRQSGGAVSWAGERGAGEGLWH